MHVTLIYLAILLQLGLFSKGLRAVDPTISFEFDQILSTEECSKGSQTVDKTVFKAVLNTTNTKPLDWPLDRIMLGYINYDIVYYSGVGGYEKLCEINVEDDGCKGFQPTQCGYCNTTANGIYYIIFNITVPESNSLYQEHKDDSVDFLCSWVGKKATIRDKTSVVITRSHNMTVFLQDTEHDQFFFTPDGKIVHSTSKQERSICERSWINSMPTNIDYSVGNNVYSHVFNNSRSCFDLDEVGIGLYQHEMIEFNYSGICNQRTEFQCSGRGILQKRLSCGYFAFTNFTDAGRNRLRVTWICVTRETNGVNCAICWSLRSTFAFYVVASAKGELKRQSGQDHPVYKYTCELETNLSEINTSTLGPSYELAIVTSSTAASPLCPRYLDYSSIYQRAFSFEPTITLEFDPSLSVTQCGVLVESGNKIVFKAILKGSNAISADWPVDKIVLRHRFFQNDGFQDLCEINIEQDGCKGFQASLCGYCNATYGRVYHIVFNVTAPYVDMNSFIYDWVDESFQCLWVGRDATVLDTSRVKIDSNGNTTWRAYITETQVMHLSSERDVVSQSPKYHALICDIYAGKLPGYLNYSVGGQFNASASFGIGTRGCLSLDEDVISALQQPDEKILFHQYDDCSGAKEYECLGKDLVKQKLFCMDLIFTNFTDGGMSRVRVTWTCMNNDPLLITCQLGWSDSQTNGIRVPIANSYEYYRKKLDQNNPVYYYTCQLEVDSSEIYNNAYGSFLHLATVSSQQYSLQQCTGYSNSLSQSLPLPRISSDCPVGKWVKNGYIRMGTTATCLCEIVNFYNGGKVQWFDSTGVEISFAGSTANLAIDTKDENQAYICRGLSDSGILPYAVKYVPRLTPGPAVANFTVNETSSLVVQQGSDVTFSCDVESIFPATAVLVGTGRGQIQEFRSQNQSLEFHLSNLTCEDSGRYECRGDDGVEFKALNSEEFVDVNVNCDIKLKDPPAETSTLKYSFQPQDSVVITLEVYGYPEPTEYGLRVQQNSGISDVSKDMYSVTYTKLKPPFGLVTIEFVDKETKKSTTYVLNIKNGVGEGVDITFVVNKEPDAESESSLPWLEIGIGIGGLILIIAILIIIICLVKRKRAHNKARNRQTETDDYTTLDFSLSDMYKQTQQPKPAAQTTSDERHKNQTSRGLKSHGPLPDIPDNDSHVNLTDYEVPKDATDYVDHVDTLDYVVPEDLTDYVDPEDSKDNADPEDSTDYVDPEDSKDNVDPEDSTDYVDREDSTDYVDPEDSKDNVDPEDSTDYVDREDSTDYVDPEDSTDYVDPEDSTDYVGHVDSPDYVIPEESTDYVDHEDSIDYVDPVNSADVLDLVDSKDDPDPEGNDKNGYSSYIESNYK